MKRISTLLFSAFMILQLNAQITFEKNYSVPYTQFYLLKLEYSGYKYYTLGNGIALYNLDHTLFRQLSLPTLAPGTSNLRVGFVTEALFDSDTTNIEYLLTYTNGSAPNSVGYTRVCDENGNILFSKDGEIGFTNADNKVDYLGPINTTIYNTNEGAKMLLSPGGFSASVSVYSLPGLLQCNICDGQRSVPLRIDPNFNDSGMNIYPNPSDSYTVVDFELAQDVSNAELVIYDVQGKVTGRYSINNGMRQLIVPTSNLSSGSYYYIFEQSGKAISNKVIVKH